MMWVEKYRPKNIAEIIGNEEEKASFYSWLSKKHKKKAVLLYGPPGIGKTTLVTAAAKGLKYNVIEMNASDDRTRKAIIRIAGPASLFSSLDKFSRDIENNLILLDEVDGLYGKEDLGGVNAILRIVQESRIPIVLTANTIDIQKLRPMMNVCHLIRLRKVRVPLIVAFLRKICEMENITCETEALESISQKSQGDVRSAVNDLQTLCQGKTTLKKEDTQHIPTRNKGIFIFDTLRGMFSAASHREAMKILKSSLTDHDTLLLAIHDNLPLQYQDPEKLATAYDILSKADVFRGRIREEKWQLLTYYYELLARSTVVAHGEFKPFNIIYPPMKRLMLAWTKPKRNTLEAICAKIANKCHVSRRIANLEFLPFLRLMIKKDSSKTRIIVNWLKLDNEMIAFLNK